MFASAWAASGQIARATAELRQACDTISTQRREFAKIAQLTMSIKILEGNIAFYKVSEADLKGKLAKIMAKSTRLEESFDGTRTPVLDLREKLAPKDAVVRSIVQDSCVTLRPSRGFS